MLSKDLAAPGCTLTVLTKDLFILPKHIHASDSNS